ncbi:MAG: MFS transporter [Candidatus Acidiferrales bacterium]|jgi:MFS family permease
MGNNVGVLAATRFGPPMTFAILKAGASVAPAPAAPKPSLGYAWYVVFVLMLCYTLSFVDRQILSLLVGPIKRDLMISDTQMGLLLGFAFAVFYTFAGLPIGRLVDTYGRRNPIAIGIFLWSIMTAVCSVARSYWTLFLARVGVGVGEATLSPAAFSLISDYFPAEKLGLAISVYTMGIFIGSGVALAMGGSIVDTVMHMPALHLPVLGTIATWRLSFLLVGIPGLLVALLVYTVREPLRKNVLRDAAGRAAHLNTRDVFMQIGRRWQSFWGMAIGQVFQSLASYAFLSWAPTFFQRMHGWTAGQAGRALGVLVLSCGCLGMYVGGLLCDRWLRKGVAEGPLKVATISAVGSCVFLGLAMVMHDARVSLILIAPGLFFQAMPIGTVYAAVQLIFPNQIRGQVSALFMFTLNLGGIGLGPLIPGVLNDHVFRNERMIGPSVSITVALACACMLVLFPLTYSHYRRDYRALNSPAAEHS